MTIDMTMDRWAWETAEALAPDAAAVCGLKEITGLALWKVTLTLYKCLLGKLSHRQMADKVARLCAQSERDARRGMPTLPIVAA